jgi:hypothetical protein
MPMRNCRNNVFGPKSGVSTKNTLGLLDWKVRFIDMRHVPFAELNAEIALDPRECIVLANGNQDLIGLEKDLFARRDKVALA